MSSQNITNIEELNDAIEKGPNRKVGFLSKANFWSVQSNLSTKVEPEFFRSTAELYNAVNDGNVIAGLTSGVVHDDAIPFNVFPAEVISPRAFQMKKNDSGDLMKAVDAAVVRTQLNKEVYQAMVNNKPFRAKFVQNIYYGDVQKVPFPAASDATGLLASVLEKRTLRILAYGKADSKPNWHEDGNYQVDPPTGFWPDYVDYFMKHFREEYGSDIKLERVWMDNDMGTEMVLAGIVHMTEPYYIYEGLALGKEPRKWSHDFSAIIMGYEQQFMTLKFCTDDAEI